MSCRQFPTLPGAEKFGINFASETEEERECQLDLGRARPHLRTRHTQTRPPIIQTSDAEVQFQVPALEAETQFQVSVNDVEMQTEFHSSFDNFGLPSGLTLAAVIRATRQRGADIAWLVHGIETEYCTDWNRNFIDAERSNVRAVVSLIAATRRDEVFAKAACMGTTTGQKQHAIRQYFPNFTCWVSLGYSRQFSL